MTPIDSRALLGVGDRPRRARQERDGRDLQQRLAEAEAVIQALLSGQLDAVVDAASGTPVLLATADLVDRTRTLEQQATVLTEQAALLELAPTAVIVRDMDHRILFWNRGAEVMFGWPRADAIGQVAFELLRSELPEPIASLSATLLREGQWAGEAVHYRRDGSQMIVASRWALQRDAEGAPTRILTINNDITDRKRADAERRLLTERLSLATAVAKVGVWDWDLASNAITWDATMCDIYGVPSDGPMAYDRWAGMVHPDDRPSVEASLHRAIDDKGQGAAEFRIIIADGSIRHISAAQRAVLDNHVHVSRVIGVNMDVTERRHAEEALERTRRERLRFKDDFLSHVSHELRSPLTAVKQFTTILLGGLAGELNAEQRQYQQIVLKNVGQLQTMIDDLLEVTRLEAGKVTVELESVFVADAVTDAVHTLQETARDKGVNLSWDVETGCPSAYADPTRLRQVLIILLDNAIKFTPRGGSARIGARQLDHDPAVLLLEVSDTGCGLSPESATRIFDRLYQESDPAQASREGLGLGLFICKELVTRQGGWIWAEGQPQHGSTFSFTLPVFSLSTVLAPLLKNDRWPTESVALVTVDVGLPSGAASESAHQELRNEARSVVRRCLLPDLDVLLPKVSARAGEEHVWIAAFADEKGATVLANRLREQFDRRSDLKKRGVVVSVSFCMQPPCPSDVGATIKETVTRMAASLEAAVRHQNGAGAAHHEQQEDSHRRG